MAGTPKKRERRELAAKLAAGVSLTAKDPHLDDSLLEATNKAITQATADGILTDADAGAVELLRSLAKKIDAWETIVEWALDDAAEAGPMARPKVPAADNNSPGTYARLAEQLGLTPSGRVALGVKKADASPRAGKLTALRTEAARKAVG